MKPRIAFVGVAHWHAPIYRDCLSRLGVDVVGASDLDAQAGREAAGRLGLPFSPDAADMLARCRPDFVFVTPRHDRALEEIAPVLDRRLPFLVEKPMGIDGRVAAEVARRAAAAGAWAAPALPNRLLEIWDRVDRLSAEGRLGTVMHASFRLINGPPGRYRTLHRVPWMLDPAIGGGGALRNLGMHGADAILRLARGAEPLLHAARTTAHGHGERVDEYASALMTLPGGAVMQMEAGYSWAPPTGGDFEWRIAATGAYLQQGKGRLVVRMADGAVEELETVQPSYQPMVERVLADFAAGRPPFATLAECAAATALCDRVYEAAARPG
ncbi:MAG: Gfo/Idh/MocA family oxidoreductase [Alphaproteobacteria bacterium]|nr:Gfo/Idh/MocA family oxidoreductase [Alphaproteobacteria bacterium]